MTAATGRNGSGIFLSFSISPVQDYVEAARTVRDLWTGSYMLSWLTATAAVAVTDKLGGSVFSPVMDGMPLVELVRQIGRGEKPQPRKDGEDLMSCLPNTFIAQLPQGTDPAKAKGECVAAAAAEWKRIADAVRTHLHKSWDGEWPGWDAGWDDQVDNHWDFRVCVMDGSDPDRVKRAAVGLGIRVDTRDTFQLAIDLLARVAGSAKMIRHVPPAEDPSDLRPKCILTGAHAQMGPTTSADGDTPMETARKFWEKAAPKAHKNWERLQTKDRFGAVALVKRFAWSQYFGKKLGRAPQDKRVWDTATIAAAGWIAGLGKNGDGRYLHEEIEALCMTKTDYGHWSGQWLHAEKANDDADADDHLPSEVFDRLVALRKSNKKRAPTYYAVLALDGDHMGRRMAKADRAGRETRSKALQTFALEKVGWCITDYLGDMALDQPVYAGGDDVLALLPLFMPDGANGEKCVLECAKAIRDAFAGLADLRLPGEDAPTASAGLAIVHHKADLREALAAARRAEKAAKEAGRDRLGIAVVRRSSGETMTVTRWEHVPRLMKLAEEFRKGKTDRWAYGVHAMLVRLAGRDPRPGANGEGVGCAPDNLAELMRAELKRSLASSEKAPEGVLELWDELVAGEPKDKPGAETKADKAAADALALMLAMSFLARGREE